MMIFSFDILNAEKNNSIKKLNAIKIYTLVNKTDTKQKKSKEQVWQERYKVIWILLSLLNSFLSWFKEWFSAGRERNS